MNIVKMTPFAVWMYQNLSSLRKYKKEIARAKEAGDKDAEREAILGATITWGREVSEKIKLDLTIEGHTDLPDGPVLFVSNHQGYADILAFCLAIQDKQFGFVAKDNLFKIPVFGEWIERVRSISIEREDPRASLRAIEHGIEYLNEGYSLAIFPEGTRSKGDEMGKFKKGSLRLATKAGVPIVPITISGTWHAYEERGYMRPTHAYFYFHRAIDTKYLDRKTASNLAETIEGIVRNKLNEYNSKK